jgi:hypothetical protein
MLPKIQKKINDRHRVNGSWRPGSRSPIAAKLQSGGRLKGGFKFQRKMIINDSRKKACVMSNKTCRPKFKKKQ